MNTEGRGGTGAGADFDALARRYFGAWGDALQAGGASLPGNANPADWKQVLDWWAQLLPERGPGAADDALNRFRQQAGGWYGTMQQVAARFAGRDTTSAEVASAWREAVMGQGNGDGLLQWMLQGARGGEQAAGGLDAAMAMLAQWQQQLAPWLQSPAFGPGREHQARWQRLLREHQAFQARSSDYMAQIRQALDAAFVLFEQRLAEHEAPGSQLTSARAMFDLWIEAAEEAYAKVALSEAFQQVYADLGNTQMRLRAGLQQEIEQLGAALGMPTRTEMDAAHRRIAELERQLRRLQSVVDGIVRGASDAVGDAAVPPASTGAGDGSPAAVDIGDWAEATQPAVAKVPRPRRRSGAAASSRRAAAPSEDTATAAAPATAGSGAAARGLADAPVAARTPRRPRAGAGTDPHDAAQDRSTAAARKTGRPRTGATRHKEPDA